VSSDDPFTDGTILIAEAMEALATRSDLPDEQRSRLAEAAQNARLSAKSTDLSAFATLLAGTNLTSSVQFRTVKPAARIRYCLIVDDGNDGLSVNRLTNEASAVLPIGLYNVWAERDEKPTSSRTSAFAIIKREEILDITEFTSTEGQNESAPGQ
jgi:hypothetical protein